MQIACRIHSYIHSKDCALHNLLRVFNDTDNLQGQIGRDQVTDMEHWAKRHGTMAALTFVHSCIGSCFFRRVGWGAGGGGGVQGCFNLDLKNPVRQSFRSPACVW